MLIWFTTLNGAITFSIFAFLTMMARITFLDAMFVPEFRNLLPEDQPVNIALMMLWYMVFIGGWVWSLLSAARGNRRGLIVSLIYSLFVALGGGLLTLLFLCPAGCAAWPVGNLIVWLNLISGLMASFALGIQLNQIVGQRKRMSKTMSGETA
ncbi:MAG: hypothetical protein SF029_10955 [bacterium]|nr:hypothetical protein [bacterium]